LNGRPIRVSQIDALSAATLSSGNVQSLAASDRWPHYGRVVAGMNRVRGYGDFLHYHLLAAGKIDAVVESDVNILDIAACVAIVAEAGGRFTDLAGAAVGLNTTSVLATNGRLHEKLLAELRGD
jgi:histidinol-phosphatase